MHLKSSLCQRTPVFLTLLSIVSQNANNALTYNLHSAWNSLKTKEQHYKVLIETIKTAVQDASLRSTGSNTWFLKLTTVRNTRFLKLTTVRIVPGMQLNDRSCRPPCLVCSVELSAQLRCWEGLGVAHHRLMGEHSRQFCQNVLPRPPIMQIISLPFPLQTLTQVPGYKLLLSNASYDAWVYVWHPRSPACLGTGYSCCPRQLYFLVDRITRYEYQQRVPLCPLHSIWTGGKQEILDLKVICPPYDARCNLKISQETDSTATINQCLTCEAFCVSTSTGY